MTDSKGAKVVKGSVEDVMKVMHEGVEHRTVERSSEGPYDPMRVVRETDAFKKGGGK